MTLNSTVGIITRLWASVASSSATARRMDHSCDDGTTQDDDCAMEHNEKDVDVYGGRRQDVQDRLCRIF